MENIYKNFEQQYPVNKTLRFELKPLGETSEYIRNSNLLNEDKDRAGDFERVKGILDRYYKNYISKKVTNPHFKWGFNISGSAAFPWFRQRRVSHYQKPVLVASGGGSVTSDRPLAYRFPLVL